MAAKPLTGTKVLLMLVAFFGVVIGVNVTMMKLAIATLPGTEVDSPYAAGLVYDREISAAQDQAARKWKVSAHIERRADGNAVLQVEARDAADRPVTGLTFEGRLERPTDKRADLAVELAEAGSGVYRGNAASVAPGQWDLVIEGDAKGERVFLSRNRVILN
ncbi:FixH family protein [Bradyrhizobium guangdongense]|uniref:Nitrogen fixation protein FixH n=1 Tax=Bradyrhizobium guangdongense TaxID=1325090 RepID=A0A410VB42_9BRAD|nr:FixH family protein [Bradyrhizobium guangdongense]QAU40932.1 nitrogen fixation protein FixH [Bradyrhizobium guangdongense]QOZ61993.1 nitrogen fixation protein FixH [Bradyrhizobium guangdongense]GGI21400.1 nitrogen fixation protein FixH [Bradyrhizobium guangdongense]